MLFSIELIRKLIGRKAVRVLQIRACGGLLVQCFFFGVRGLAHYHHALSAQLHEPAQLPLVGHGHAGYVALRVQVHVPSHDRHSLNYRTFVQLSCREDLQGDGFCSLHWPVLKRGCRGVQEHMVFLLGERDRLLVSIYDMFVQ